MELPNLGHSGLGTICLSTIFFIFVYIISTIIYLLTLHPLASYPGPVWTRASRIPFWIACLTGDQVLWMHSLHTKYGPWKAIHGHEKGGRELPKAREWFVEPANGIYGINSAPAHEHHRRFRKLFAPAFSERALKSNEPVLRKHVDLLVRKLGEVANAGRPVDMVRMFQFTTFDFMGDLTFGLPLGLLQGLKYSPWVEAVFDSIKVTPVAQIIQYYPWLHSLFKRLEPRFVKDMKYNHFKHSADRVDLRLERGPAEKPDIWSMVLAAKGDQQLSLEEMYCHADVFMLAGSETSGSTLSGLTYHLLSNPEKLEILKNQIHSLFKHEDEITLQSTAGIEYLNACIQEALRLYPPVPVGVPRVVTEAGLTIRGQWVASGTRVSVHHYATYRSPLNFADPDTFAPERWLSGGGDSLAPYYENDRRESCQPFAYGPRDCLGRNLAMHEMRYVMARVLFNFDLKLRPESDCNIVGASNQAV
ncbi:uncharacterized protein PG986_003628 [Apiospora aurea]|uniref:Cytochrome P450 monooxygenase n=1 Tax=Apiospora aurea TaxID=335848 RepID=A0ABR1QSM1_9PEZI